MQARRPGEEFESMRTAAMIVVGVVLAIAFDLIVAALKARGRARETDAGRLFILTWLGIMIVDFYAGVSEGNAVPLELSVHALLFVVPAGAAWWLSRRRQAHPPAEQ
jgi:hypothetical protein